MFQNVDGIMSDLDAHLEGEERTRRDQEKLAKIRRDQRRIKQEVCGYTHHFCCPCVRDHCDYRLEL